MSRDWTTEELQAASAAMKAMGHMGYEEFCESLKEVRRMELRVNLNEKNRKDLVAAIAEITCAGSLMILALGLNLIGLTKFKVANFLPALLFSPLFSWLFTLLPFAI